MGLDVQSLRLFLVARRMGVRIDRILTLGRQDLLMTPEQISSVCTAFGMRVDDSEAREIAFAENRFCEPMLKKLGAVAVDSMDASDFEGANVIHDLNRPISADLKERYDVIFDGGTLEHVFHFPTAIKGCLEMVKAGGHMIMTSPANNHMGHGFYQFSPDLFCRIFSEANGYCLKALFLVPTFTEGDWYAVKDPAAVGSRVGHNRAADERSLFVIAERTAIVPIFATPPQQSDYSAHWSKSDTAGSGNRLAFFDAGVAAQKTAEHGWKARLRKLIPPFVLREWKAYRLGRLFAKPPNPNHFERFPLP